MKTVYYGGCLWLSQMQRFPLFSGALSLWHSGLDVCGFEL